MEKLVGGMKMGNKSQQNFTQGEKMENVSTGI